MESIMHRIREALRGLDCRVVFETEDTRLTVQVISEQFRGVPMVDRIYQVLELLESFADEVFEETQVRIEVYTSDRYDQFLLDQMRSVSGQSSSFQKFPLGHGGKSDRQAWGLCESCGRDSERCLCSIQEKRS